MIIRCYTFFSGCLRAHGLGLGKNREEISSLAAILGLTFFEGSTV